jgi:hypothetical protein
LVTQAQNEELKALSESTFQQGEQVKRISAWAAILFAPTLIGTIYGINVVNLPGGDEPWGIWLSIVLMAGVSLVLYLIFNAAAGYRILISHPTKSSDRRITSAFWSEARLARWPSSCGMGGSSRAWTRIGRPALRSIQIQPHRWSRGVGVSGPSR